MEELTRTEERVMQAIWELNTPFFIKDLVERMPGKPPYNTILSVVRILESKGFLRYKAYGRTNISLKFPRKITGKVDFANCLAITSMVLQRAYFLSWPRKNRLRRSSWSS